MPDLSIAVLWPFARHGRPSPGGRCARHRGWSGGSRCRLVERRMRWRRIGWAPELDRGVGERLTVDGARGRLRRRPVIAARTAGSGIGVRLRGHGLRAAPPAREWADGLCHERRGHGAGPARRRSRPGPRRGRAGRHACPTTRSLQQLHGVAVRNAKNGWRSAYRPGGRRAFLEDGVGGRPRRDNKKPRAEASPQHPYITPRSGLETGKSLENGGRTLALHVFERHRRKALHYQYSAIPCATPNNAY